MYNRKCDGLRLSAIEKDPSASRIYDHILSNDPNRAYLYIILGRPGPTGKTTMANNLRVSGYDAVEITEELLAAGRVNGEHNAFVVNEARRYALIVLNRFVK